MTVAPSCGQSIADSRSHACAACPTLVLRSAAGEDSRQASRVGHPRLAARAATRPTTQRRRANTNRDELSTDVGLEGVMVAPAAARGPVLPILWTACG